MPRVKVCLGKAAWHEGWGAQEAPVELLSIISQALGPAALAWLNRVQLSAVAEQEASWNHSKTLLKSFPLQTWLGWRARSLVQPLSGFAVGNVGAVLP